MSFALCVFSLVSVLDKLEMDDNVSGTSRYQNNRPGDNSFIKNSINDLFYLLCLSFSCVVIFQYLISSQSVILPSGITR